MQPQYYDNTNNMKEFYGGLKAERGAPNKSTYSAEVSRRSTTLHRELGNSIPLSIPTDNSQDTLDIFESYILPIG